MDQVNLFISAQLREVWMEEHDIQGLRLTEAYHPGREAELSIRRRGVIDEIIHRQQRRERSAQWQERYQQI